MIMLSTVYESVLKRFYSGPAGTNSITKTLSRVTTEEGKGRALKILPLLSRANIITCGA